MAVFGGLAGHTLLYYRARLMELVDLVFLVELVLLVELDFLDFLDFLESLYLGCFFSSWSVTQEA